MFSEIESDFKCGKTHTSQLASQTSMHLSSDTCTHIVCLFFFLSLLFTTSAIFHALVNRSRQLETKPTPINCQIFSIFSPYRYYIFWAFSPNTLYLYCRHGLKLETHAGEVAFRIFIDNNQITPENFTFQLIRNLKSFTKMYGRLIY